jgi:large subunit ribosomal protein L22
MPGVKTNEREGTRAVLRHAHISPYKVREVLDLVRGRPVHEAEDILRFSERDAAFTVGKLLQSAVANAQNNDELDPEELFVSACYADEGTTIKRWRPRARGRATRIRKRTSHITVIVSRLPEERLERLQAHRRAEQLAQRARRVAGARRNDSDTRNRADRRANVPIETDEHDHDDPDHEQAAPEATTASEATGAVQAGGAPTAAEVTEAEHSAAEAGGPTAVEIAEVAAEAAAADAELARAEAEVAAAEAEAAAAEARVAELEAEEAAVDAEAAQAEPEAGDSAGTGDES